MDSKWTPLGGDHSTGAEVQRLDRWLHPGIPQHLSADVDLQGGIRWGGPHHCPPQVHVRPDWLPLDGPNLGILRPGSVADHIFVLSISNTLRLPCCRGACEIVQSSQDHGASHGGFSIVQLSGNAQRWHLPGKILDRCGFRDVNHQKQVHKSLCSEWETYELL